MVRGYLSRRDAARRAQDEADAAHREAAVVGARVRSAGQAAAARWLADGREFDCMIEIARGTRAGLARGWRARIEGWYLGAYAGYGDLRVPQPAALDRNGNFWLGRFDAGRRALQSGRPGYEKIPSEGLLELLE